MNQQPKGSIGMVLNSAMEWLPIETAPKNGSFVILGGPSGYMNTPIRCEIARWSDDRESWVNHSNDRFTDGGEEATCWMALPCNGNDYGNEWRQYQLAKKFEITNNQAEFVLDLYKHDFQKAADHIEEWGPNKKPSTLNDLCILYPDFSTEYIASIYNICEQDVIKATRFLMIQDKLKMKVNQ